MKDLEGFEYLEFDLSDTGRFAHLVAVFERLKDEKERYFRSGEEPSVQRKDWVSYFDKGALEWFDSVILLPNSEEKAVFDQLWKISHPEKRVNHPMFNTGEKWSLESVISVIYQGDYELISIIRSGDTARLYFDPGGYPFGGTDALVQLIEAFGHVVIYDSWHEGPHKRIEVGWNYELAKKMVEVNQGIGYSDKGSTRLKVKSKRPWWPFW